MSGPSVADIGTARRWSWRWRFGATATSSKLTSEESGTIRPLLVRSWMRSRPAGSWIIPSGAMALGVPAELREGTVTPGQFEQAVVSYVERGRRFRVEMRRLG